MTIHISIGFYNFLLYSAVCHWYEYVVFTSIMNGERGWLLIICALLIIADMLVLLAHCEPGQKVIIFSVDVTLIY